jgi:hypothetical protein
LTQGSEPCLACQAVEPASHGFAGGKTGYGAGDSHEHFFEEAGRLVPIPDEAGEKVIQVGRVAVE